MLQPTMLAGPVVHLFASLQGWLTAENCAQAVTYAKYTAKRETMHKQVNASACTCTGGSECTERFSGCTARCCHGFCRICS
jgi:hypothetical protein